MRHPSHLCPLVVALASVTSACDGQGYVVASGVTAASGAAAATGSGASTPSTQSSSSGTSGSTDGGGTSSTPGTTSGGGSTTPDPGSSTKTTCTTTTDTFANFANAALTTNCASCHSGEWDTVAEASSAASSLRGQLSSGSMPPSGNSLDATVKARLLTWLNCPTPLP